MRFLNIIKCLSASLFINSLNTFGNIHPQNTYIDHLVDTVKIEKLTLSNDSSVLDYVFRDTSDRPVRISDFRGKFVFVDLWYSGCGFCIYANRALSIVHEKLKHENIVFLSISVDQIKAKWIESITKDALPSKLNPWAGKYYPSPGTIILYTGGNGYRNDFIKKYNFRNGYPKLLLIDPSGKLISDDPPRPDGITTDHPEKLIDFIMNYINKLD